MKKQEQIHIGIKTNFCNIGPFGIPELFDMFAFYNYAYDHAVYRDHNGGRVDFGNNDIVNDAIIKLGNFTLTFYDILKSGGKISMCDDVEIMLPEDISRCRYFPFPPCEINDPRYLII